MVESEANGLKSLMRVLSLLRLPLWCSVLRQWLRILPQRGESSAFTALNIPYENNPKDI